MDTGNHPYLCCMKDNILVKRDADALNRADLDSFRASAKIPLIFVLDNIRSGANVGSIFRTADAFALREVVLCGITAQPPHREILKTALGATETVRWLYTEDVEEALDRLRTEQVAIWAAEQTEGAVMAHDFRPDPDRPMAIVLGNEVDGVSQAALTRCEGSIEIPQYGTKHSLNVAVAAGILAWTYTLRWQGG